MKLGKSMQLGELYRELRIARGLKLKDIVRDNLSVSQLSRFEDGQTMLAADKLLIAISGIHMTFPEFGHTINNYEETSFFKLGNVISDLYNKQGIDGLRRLFETDRNAESFGVYDRLDELIIKIMIYSLDPSYAITEDEENFLTSHLYEIEEWIEYEPYIFGNIMTILSDDDLIFLGKAFVERDKLYLSLPNHKKSVELAFLNLILTLISYRRIYQVIYFIECLEKIITYQDMFATICLNFSEKTIAHIENGSGDFSDSEHYIACVEEAGSPTIVAFLKANLSGPFGQT